MGPEYVPLSGVGQVDFYKCCVFDKAGGPVELIRPADPVEG